MADRVVYVETHTPALPAIPVQYKDLGGEAAFALAAIPNALGSAGVEAAPNSIGGVYVMSRSGATVDNLPADNDGGPRTLAVAPAWYNEATWDRQRNNLVRTALASAARTVLTSSPDQINYNHRGFRAYLNVTVNPGGAETLTLQFEDKDPVSGLYRAITTFAATAAAANGLYILNAASGAVLTTATTNVQNQGVAPGRTFRVTVTPSGAGSWTYSVGLAGLV